MIGGAQRRFDLVAPAERAFSMLQFGSRPAWTIAYAPSTCIIGRVRSQSTSSFASRASEHIVEGVVLSLALEAFVLRDEVQVVVTQHRHRALAEVTHEAQHLERFRAAVDQVADEPQPVFLLLVAALFSSAFSSSKQPCTSPIA